MDGEGEKLKDPEADGSEEETDSECEEEVFQSDGEVILRASPCKNQRKRWFSETTGKPSSSSASTSTGKTHKTNSIHNERERERRKDLKVAVYKLRNQLQMNKTKKATIISVLKASEKEITALKSMEARQIQDVEDLTKHNNHLTWKLEQLINEHKKSSSDEKIPSLPPPAVQHLPAASPAASIATSTICAPPPNSTRSMAAGLPPTESVLLPHPMATMFSNRFPFGTPTPTTYSPFQYPLLGPGAASSLQLPSHSNHFSLHPPPTTPFVLLSPPQLHRLPLPSLVPGLPHLPGATTSTPQGAFSPPSPYPVSFHPVVPPISSPWSVVFPSPLYSYSPNAQLDTSGGATTRETSRSCHIKHSSEHCETEGQSESSKESVGASPSTRLQGGEDVRDEEMEASRQVARQARIALQPMEQEEPVACTTEQFIDVEALEQDEEHQPPQIYHNTSDIVPPHSVSIPGRGKSHRSHQGENPPSENDLQCTQRPKNLRSPPALLKRAGVEGDMISGIIKRVKPDTHNPAKGVYTSVLKKHRQIVKQGRNSSTTNALWKQRNKNVETGHFSKPPQHLTIPVKCS